MRERDRERERERESERERERERDRVFKGLFQSVRAVGESLGVCAFECAF